MASELNITNTLPLIDTDFIYAVNEVEILSFTTFDYLVSVVFLAIVLLTSGYLV